MRKEVTALGLIAATYFIVSGGPYGLEDLIAQTGYGLGILILCLVPFLWALPTALMVGELASAIPDTGGFYVWVRRALGKFWGFQEAWLSLAASIFDLGIYPLLFISYLGVLAPTLVAGWRGAAIATALVLACTGWNMRGAKSVGDGSIGLGALMVSPFIVLTMVGLWHAHHVVTAIATHPANPAIMGGVLVAMWNFMGWDNAGTFASEVKNPQRTYPRAMIATLGVIIASYLLPIGAAWYFGIPLAAWSTGSWAAIGGAIAGPIIRDAIVVGGMLSSTGMLLSLLMSYSRLPVALAQDELMPQVFKKVNVAALPLIALFALGTVWLSAFGLNFNRLVMLDIMLYGTSLVLEFVALAVLRWKEPDLERTFSVPGGKLGAVMIGVCPTALLVLAGVYGDHNGLVAGVGAIIAGIAVWYGMQVAKLFKKPAKAVATAAGD